MTQRKASEEEIDKALSGGGIVFRKAPLEDKSPKGVKTKAKKKTYIRGTHGSAAAKHKAEIRRRRAARPSQHKGQ